MTHHCDGLGGSSRGHFYDIWPLGVGIDNNQVHATNPNLPWFNKTLGATTNEDIEH